jgi:hypothetical protein
MGRGGEDPRKISGLAVSKIGAEARSHTENAVGQFRGKSYPMEVQYRTPRREGYFWELLAELDG